jgi:predicted ATPase
MLRRIIIDNYKSFVNFEYRPSKCELLIGDNGMGKSTLFEVLSLLREMIVEGKDVIAAFPESTLTRWDERDEQMIELDIEDNGGIYHYDINVRHFLTARKTVIYQEALTFNGELLFSAQNGTGLLHTLSLFPDKSMPINSNKVEMVLIDPTRSGLFFISQIDTLPDKIKWFIDWIRGLFVIRINPYGMDSNSITDIEHPSVNMANFASWYRHLIQQNSEIIKNSTAMLRQVMPGFSSLSLQKEGEQTRVLKSLFTTDDKNAQPKFDFNELSEG